MDQPTDAAPDTPSRPSRPTTVARRPVSGRPVLPGAGVSRSEIEPGPEVVDVPVAEPVVVAPPPPPPALVPWWAGTVVRRTLIPPTAVLAIGFAALGTYYLIQPEDAAVRTLPAGLAYATLAVAGIAVAGTAALGLSVRRR